MEQEVNAMFQFLICFIAGIGAGLGTGFAGMPNILCLVFCVASTLLWARIAAVTLNRATGVVLTILGISIRTVNYLP